MTQQRREASSASDSGRGRTVACTMLSDQIGTDQIRKSCSCRTGDPEEGGRVQGQSTMLSALQRRCSVAVAVNNQSYVASSQLSQDPPGPY